MPPPPSARPRVSLVTKVFVPTAVFYMGFAIYIVVVDRDLTALLVGLLILVIVYAFLRLLASWSRKANRQNLR